MHNIIKNIKHIFITGTDTSVGKSIFTASLALSLLNKGKKVAISKPLQTGKEKDTDFLAKLIDNKAPIFNTYSFSLPAAPLVAAKYENREIKTEKILSDIKKLEKEFDYVIVEGIGGIAVPIHEARSRKQEAGEKKQEEDSCFLLRASYLVADLIKDLNYSTIVVARATLGTINHTVLTIEFAKQKGLNILGFVVSDVPRHCEEQSDEAISLRKTSVDCFVRAEAFPRNDANSEDSYVIKTAPDIISEITGVKCLFKIPFYDSLVANEGSFSSNAPSCLANV